MALKPLPVLSDAEIEQMIQSFGEPFDHNALGSWEIFWRDHWDWLQQKGYLLRPRYKPDWVPSWRNHPNPDLNAYEDGLSHMVREF